MYIPTIVQHINGAEFHYDLYSRLLKDRIIMLNTEVEEEICSSIVGQLLFLDSESHDEITLFINSPGGSVYAGLSVYDIINSIKSPVKTVCTGMAASMGAFLLASGEKGSRFCSKSARIMIHSISSGYHGNYHDMVIDMKENDFVQKYLTEELAKNTGQSVAKVKKDIARDKWLSAEEAIKYGIIDGIL